MNFQESQIGWLAAQNAYVTKKDQGDKVIIFDRANAIFGELHSDMYQGSANAPVRTVRRAMSVSWPWFYYHFFSFQLPPHKIFYRLSYWRSSSG